MNIITKTFETTLTADAGERAVVAKISTMSVDREGEVLFPSGLDASEFNQNPVVLLMHDKGSLPVGKVVNIKKQANEVVAKVVFAARPESLPDDEEWVPDTVFSLYQQKVLRAFSVGLGRLESRAPNAKDISRFGDNVQIVTPRWKMYELSVCPVPMNQDALAVAVSKSWIGRSWNKANKSQEKSYLELALPEVLDLTIPTPFDLEAA